VYDDVTYVYDDVTYVYDDVTYVYDDVTYVYLYIQLFSAHPWIWGRKKATTETNGKNKRYL